MVELKAKVGTRGQIVIPKPIRDILHINAGDTMCLRVETDEILVRKESDSDILDKMFSLFEKLPVPENLDWKELYYSQFEEKYQKWSKNDTLFGEDE